MGQMDDFEKELLEASEQRSQVWRDVRCGRFTASEFWKLMGEPRSKADKEAGNFSQTALTYIHTKVAEELTGQVHESSPAYPLVWGEEQEPNAKVLFEETTGNKVIPCTFQPFTDHSGGSPDGFVLDTHILEIKCPYNSSNQIDYLFVKTIWDILEMWPEYFWQVQMNMVFAKRSRGYFVTYDPRFKEQKHRMKHIEFEALPEYQEQGLKKLDKAIAKKLEILKSLSA